MSKLKNRYHPLVAILFAKHYGASVPVTLKAKREALEKAYADIGLTTPTAQTSWERDPKLKAFLKSLG